jgi:hypothetical protein
MLNTTVNDNKRGRTNNNGIVPIILLLVNIIYIPCGDLLSYRDGGGVIVPSMRIMGRVLESYVHLRGER